MKTDKITRVEVIDETGRAYIKYLEDDQEVVCDLQDDGRTLKVFVNRNQEDESQDI